MQLPAGMGNQYNSDKMHPRQFRKYFTTVFEYRVENDSVMEMHYNDTMLTYGIILPRMRMVCTVTNSRRLFSNNSQGCKLNYNTKDIFTLSESHSILSEIIFPPDKSAPDYDENKTDISYYYRYFNGQLLYNDNRDTALFSFERIYPKKTADTAQITGYIVCGHDSFLLKPYYLPVPQNDRKDKFIYMLEGLGFYKQGQLFAFLQYAPLIEPGHEKLYMYKYAGEKEQMLFAAYFVLFYDRL